MSSEDIQSEIEKLPRIWADKFKRKNELAKLHSEFIKDHPAYADEHGFVVVDDVARSREIEESLSNSQEFSIESERDADMLYAFLEGMRTVLHPMDGYTHVDLEDAARMTSQDTLD